MAGAVTDEDLPASLPQLRDDLQLFQAAANSDGSPAWVIQDPVNNAFYRIGLVEFELLSRWHLETPEAVIAATRRETPLDPDRAELGDLYGFLLQNRLLVIRNPSYTRLLLSQYRHGVMSRARWLLNHYLFFRIPLWHPSRTLQAVSGRVGWLYTRASAISIVTIGLLGLILTARQWEVFAASVAQTISPEGVLGYLLALALTKSLHEAGHAITATRYGVRVAHMGVAFLVLWPMLYTDTGESWRLRDRRQRLAIASAGILTEVAIAAIATLAWNLVDDSQTKQALLYLAAVGWVVSITLNASPFMRFDGYFILSDILDFPNLHERSFAMARVYLGNLLFGFGDDYPEPFGRRQRGWLIAFAFATWAYRLILFLGIASIVYFFFFKLLGLFLLIVEIGWFVVRPIWRVAQEWYARKAEITVPRRRLLLTAAAAMALFMVIPWQHSVTATAWAHAKESYTIYSPLPARIVSKPPDAGTVASGATLFVLDQPDVSLRTTVATLAAEALQTQLAGAVGLPEGLDRRAMLASQLDLKRAELSAELEEKSRLILKAPVAGVVSDIDPLAKEGVWVNPRQPLAIVMDPGSWDGEAFVRQSDVQRIKVGATARFYPESSPWQAIAGTVTEVDRTRTEQLPHQLLSASHGGVIAVHQDGAGLVPRDSLYRVRVRFAEPPPGYVSVLRGDMVMDATLRSWLVEAVKTMSIVAIRELSF